MQEKHAIRKNKYVLVLAMTFASCFMEVKTCRTSVLCMISEFEIFSVLGRAVELALFVR